MSESQNRCRDCGATIMQRTADEHDGLCVPCHRKAAATPPDDFEIPRDLAERALSLGEDPARCRIWAWRDGIDFAHGFLDMVAECENLYQKWAPKLREFAVEGRRSNPCPAEDSLPQRDRAKLPIYETMIQKAERLPGRRRSNVEICCLPTMAIPTAQRLWPGEEAATVLLTPDELSQWHTVYSHPDEALWWFTHYWWNIEDPPEPDSFWTRETELAVLEGSDPWLVISGLTWGDLAGGVDADLWSWDGQQAKFVEHVGCCDF